LTGNAAAADRRLIYGAAFVRAVATGMAGILVGLHVGEVLGDPAALGLIVAAGLAGGALAGLGVTWAGDRLGRRRALVALGVLGLAGGLLFALARSPLGLAAAAFLGMCNGMGRDRGASLIVEQAILPQTTAAGSRTGVFARYNLCQDAGHALGSGLAGLPAVLDQGLGLGTRPALQASLGVYALLVLLPGLLALRLSPAVEASAPAHRAQLSASSRRVLWRISALFTLDSLGSGFLTTALLTFFFEQRFGAGGPEIATLFFLARVLNALSHLVAAGLARRIGLVPTMVFTHIPSSLLLVTVTIAPSYPVAAVLFLLREGLVEMDVPTRQSYVMAVVRPEERLVASGVTHLVRLAAWAVAPSVAGLLMAEESLAAPIWVGASMKIAYDLLLWRAFRRLRPPEEAGAAARS
jgi:MFS family permease